jgi:hypothetical protein
MTMSRRVVPQRCQCGRLPTRTETGAHTCACGNQYELIRWGGLWAWFSVEPTQVGIQSLKRLLAEHPQQSTAQSLKWGVAGVVITLLLWLAVALWIGG